jgi:hypothetical protein
MNNAFEFDNSIKLHNHGDLLHPKLYEPESIEFCRSAIHAGVQTPVNGVVQLVDRAAGTDILPNVQFINPCEPAEFLTERWHVQQVGAMFGTASNLLALHKAVGMAGNAIFGAVENTATNQARLAMRAVLEASGTGFFHSAVFRPVDVKDSDFYSARLKNGLVGAGTCAVLTAGSLGVKYLGRAQDNLLGTFMRSEVGSTFISGIPGGIASAELRSHLEGKGCADSRSIQEAIYSYSVLGGAWAFGKEVFGGTGADDFLSDLMRKASEHARRREELLPASRLPRGH